jgi:hypothetical protein
VLLRIPESKQEARFCQEIVAPSDLMLSQVTNLHPHAERLFFAAIRLQKADRSPGILGTLNPKQRCQMTNHGPDRPILRPSTLPLRAFLPLFHAPDGFGFGDNVIGLFVTGFIVVTCTSCEQQDQRRSSL